MSDQQHDTATPDDGLYEALKGLAEEAGITTVWQDYRGVVHTVSATTLRALLAALELPALSAHEIAESRKHLAGETLGHALRPPLVTALVHAPIALPIGPDSNGKAYRVAFDDGTTREGRFADDGPLVVDGIDRHGYHELTCDDWSMTLAVAPSRCYAVADALTDAGRSPDERPWGLATQLYSIACDGDAGLGHFSALATLARHAAAVGASALAISPVHAMFSADLHRISPYGPSTRLLMNVLYVDPHAVLGDDAYATAVAELGGDAAARSLEANPSIDWPASSRWRLAVLRKLFDRFASEPQHADRRAAFDAYRVKRGDVLEAHARFEAVHAMLCAEDTSMLGGWRQWPAAYRDPHGDAVQAFAETHRDDVAFHAFLQWQAADQLDRAQRAAKDAGMSIGLVADLAVGADGGGSQAWSRQSDMLMGLSIGAPPDLLNALGQSWGLAAFSPSALRRTGFRAWIEMLPTPWPPTTAWHSI